MKRCTAYLPRKSCASGQRWTSHSSASLTDEALLAKVGARLNDDEYGTKITLDAKSKTISTDSGELPMSPLFDPAWIKSRRRAAKEPPRPATGQFQKHLRKNPYAPSNDAYGHIQRNNEVRSNGAPPPASVSKNGSGEQDEFTPRLTGYVASQKSLFDALSGPDKRLRGALLARRAGMGVSPQASSPVWRHDMSEVVLRDMRREATSELVQRAGAANHKFVQPCATWEDIKDVERRGCVLWLPEAEDKATTQQQQHATFDVVGAKYDGKMPVHNLAWLLGEDEVGRLCSESDVFRDNKLLVLKSWPTKTMVQVHLLLWKLQGYLDTPAT
ncbi:hypothetical protein CCM_03716 [Cordyceps militaris CM01]|uniref:Esterase-like protein n=1 Tax=Cordyceps militaris (strain CM01) TaxID=983644 RepID=G3JG66_CORMM|nr:uncharacterized protein CCM_03716 [Cordyceps militaris CM01]EGX92344.1 hypothetical protein CCM_03716 [Cordyceps militaris CM01]